jgi:hypothetical protein
MGTDYYWISALSSNYAKVYHYVYIIIKVNSFHKITKVHKYVESERKIPSFYVMKKTLNFSQLQAEKI